VSPLLRGWAALAACGAGIAHLSAALGAEPGFAAIALVIGGLEFVWGIATLALGRLLAPRLVIGLALVPVALLLLGVFTGLVGARVIPLVLAAALELTLAGLTAVGLRQTDETADPPARLATALAVGAVVVAVITAAAVATSGLELGAPLPEHSH
jgi:hypothetical protein